jgi:6-pyruvoyltetrahydropterin/6-carboxytetrahydropterin synthase
MSKGLWRLRVSSDFSSSHQLRHYEGKCEHLHGHNFAVEVEVEGRKLDAKLGILMDFKELKRLLKIVIDELDHKHLNELPAFTRQNPSSELLAEYIFLRLKELLAAHPVRLREVMVSEKESSRAYYSESAG